MDNIIESYINDITEIMYYDCTHDIPHMGYTEYAKKYMTNNDKHRVATENINPVIIKQMIMDGLVRHAQNNGVDLNRLKWYAEIHAHYSLKIDI